MYKRKQWTAIELCERWAECSVKKMTIQQMAMSCELEVWMIRDFVRKSLARPHKELMQRFFEIFPEYTPPPQPDKFPDELEAVIAKYTKPPS